MADNSWNVKPIMDFHPCDKPHGMKDYILKDLTPEQQLKLNERKRLQVREDHQYLTDHPEIRGLITMILRLLFRIRPKYDIYEVIGQYFTQSSVDLKEEIYNYLEEREKILSTDSSTLARKHIKYGFMQEDEKEKATDEDTEMEIVDELNLTNLQDLIYKDEQMKEEEKLQVSPTFVFCRQIVNGILENIFDEDDSLSMGSFGSMDFPADYNEPIIKSSSSDET